MKPASLKQDEIRLDKMFEQTKYPAEIEALAVQLADDFIERLGLVGIDQSVKELTDLSGLSLLREVPDNGR